MKLINTNIKIINNMIMDMEREMNIIVIIMEINKIMKTEKIMDIKGVVIIEEEEEAEAEVETLIIEEKIILIKSKMKIIKIQKKIKKKKKILK